MAFSSDKRKSDRGYVEGSRNIIINGKTFLLHDVGVEGVGVIVESERILFIGQRINDIDLKAGNPPLILKGIVSHITKTQAHIICGIRFEFTGPEDLKYATAFAQMVSA
jgi:hypothetical protein